MSTTENLAIEEAARAAEEKIREMTGWSRSPGSLGRPSLPVGMAGRIEHTLLGISSSDADVTRLCEEARAHSFRAVCCLPRDVSACRAALAGEPIIVVSVIDFPLGGGTDAASQCRRVVDFGADEIDMVVDVRALLRGDLASASKAVRAVVEAAAGRPVKVILETGVLSTEQIVAGCVAAEEGGAAFVKTSTGFGPRGASEQDVVLMRAAVGDRLGVKASGGIGDKERALSLVRCGADLIGTSRGPACV
jgi:deoxyribose-phosphate aldolase